MKGNKKSPPRDFIKIIEAYDPNAFVSIIDISKTFGYMFVSQSKSSTK